MRLDDSALVRAEYADETRLTAAQAYVDATILLDGVPPPVPGPIRVRRTPTIFVADR